MSDNHLGGVPCVALMIPRPLVHGSEVLLICPFMTKTEVVFRSRVVLIQVQSKLHHDVTMPHLLSTGKHSVARLVTHIAGG